MLIDLQFHSTYSDGYLTPAELAKFMAERRVKVASLTDHNTLSGLAEFRRACGRFKIKPVTGLELYVNLKARKMNLLWYNFDESSPDLRALLRETQIRRRERARAMLEKLKRRGFILDVDRIIDSYNHYVPLNHLISDIMAEPKNMAKMRRETGLKLPREEDIVGAYFRNRNIGYLRESYIDIGRVLRLREKIGGQIILNHPAKHNYIRKELWVKLKSIGVDGVEMLSPHHSIGAVMYIQQLSRDLDFITTGGSDFHRFEGYGHRLQDAWQYFCVRTRYLRRINEIIGA